MTVEKRYEEIARRLSLLMGELADILHLPPLRTETDILNAVLSQSATVTKQAAEIEALKADLDIANDGAQFYNRKAADAIVLRDSDSASQAAEISALHRQIDDLARPIMEDAAREIQQAALIQSMREALFAFAEMPTVGANDTVGLDLEFPHPITNRMILAARAALAQVSASPKEEQDER